MDSCCPITSFLCSEGCRRRKESNSQCIILNDTEKKEPCINWCLTFSLCSWIIDMVCCPCISIHNGKQYYINNCQNEPVVIVEATDDYIEL